ncbi:hypothetical protein C1N68_27120 (plasmid) [Priestia aryabhattai]
MEMLKNNAVPALIVFLIVGVVFYCFIYVERLVITAYRSSFNYRCSSLLYFLWSVSLRLYSVGSNRSSGSYYWSVINNWNICVDFLRGIYEKMSLEKLI